MSFEPITTQEEFEKRLGERLAQKDRSVRKEFEKYTSPEKLAEIKKEYDTKINNLTSELETSISEKYKDYKSPEDIKSLREEYENKIAKYETDSAKTRIAIEMGLPYEVKDRLRGSTEEELREDAKLLCGFVSKNEPPLAGGEPVPKNNGNQALEQGYRELLDGLNLEKE